MPAIDELREAVKEQREVSSGVKRRIWDEYVQTPKGRQMLACSMIQPAENMASYLERGGTAIENHVIDNAIRLLRRGLRLVGHMTVEEEELPENMVSLLRRLKVAVEARERPSRWDILGADDESDAEEF